MTGMAHRLATVWAELETAATTDRKAAEETFRILREIRNATTDGIDQLTCPTS